MLPLTEEQFKQLERDRRYTLQPARVVAHEPESQTRVIRNDIGESTYLMFSQSLVTEPWQLLALVAQRSIHQQTTLLLAAIVSVALIGFLCLRVFQQQRQLVQSEQRNSQSLEEQVARRTRELELAQQRLISESNFAMLGRMSAAINHEINQPLASLRLNLASLRTMIELPEADQDEISQIVVDSDRTTKRIARVISSLRSLVRKSDLQFHVVDLEKVVRDVFDTVQRERTVASKYLHLDIRGGDYKIMGDHAPAA
jgi:two-component system C4-dicarboxylate transport sensor histidine kinase DctB